MQGQCIGLPRHAAATWLVNSGQPTMANEQAILLGVYGQEHFLAKVNDSWWYL